MMPVSTRANHVNDGLTPITFGIRPRFFLTPVFSPGNLRNLGRSRDRLLGYFFSSRAALFRQACCVGFVD